MNLISKHPERYERYKSAVRDMIPVSANTKIAISRRLSRLHQKYWQDFAFIHINKCGGTSIERGLSIPLLYHDTALQRIETLGQEEWEKRFTFSVVRHPVDRMISLYFYRHRKSEKDYEDLLEAFPAWLDDVEKSYDDMTKPINYSGSMLSWIADGQGTVLVDAVYKLEDMKTCERDLSERLGREIKFQRVKKNKVGYDKQDILKDPSLRKRIEVLVARDLDAFGYQLDGT